MLLTGFVLACPKFNSLAALCIEPTGQPPIKFFSQLFFLICLYLSGENPHLGSGQLSINYIIIIFFAHKERKFRNFIQILFIVDREFSDILNKHNFVCIQFRQSQTYQAMWTKIAR